MNTQEIRNLLAGQCDEEYRAFVLKLTPGIDERSVLGVRAPMLRSLAKELVHNNSHKKFMCGLPHKYHEENNLHAYIIGELRDFDETVTQLRRFLPYINNWATCDSLRPKIKRKDKEAFEALIFEFLKSDETYTLRFAIEMLMVHFLGGDFKPLYAEKVAGITSDEYYINMMIAWYFATALSKNPQDILPYIENRKLSSWVHNKTIQKAVESYCIPQKLKNLLRSMRIR